MNLLYFFCAVSYGHFAPLEPAFGDSFLIGFPGVEDEERMGLGNAKTADGRLFITSILFLLFSIFLDSICNDVCAHYLACCVQDDSLAIAKQIKKERATRAAKELQDHDIACRVMRAGPTSAARCAELGALEDAARAAVGGAAEEEAFAALQDRN